MFRIKPLQCLRDTPQKEVFNEMLFDIPKFYIFQSALLCAVRSIRLSIQYFYVNYAILLQATQQLDFASRKMRVKVEGVEEKGKT